MNIWKKLMQNIGLAMNKRRKGLTTSPSGNKEEEEEWTPTPSPNDEPNAGGGMRKHKQTFKGYSKYKSNLKRTKKKNVYKK